MVVLMVGLVERDEQVRVVERVLVRRFGSVVGMPGRHEPEIEPEVQERPRRSGGAGAGAGGRPAGGMVMARRGRGGRVGRGLVVKKLGPIKVGPDVAVDAVKVHTAEAAGVVDAVDKVLDVRRRSGRRRLGTGTPAHHRRRRLRLSVQGLFRGRRHGRYETERGGGGGRRSGRRVGRVR